MFCEERRKREKGRVLFGKLSFFGDDVGAKKISVLRRKTMSFYKLPLVGGAVSFVFLKFVDIEFGVKLLHIVISFAFGDNRRHRNERVFLVAFYDGGYMAS